MERIDAKMLKDGFVALGPGIVTAAIVFGPSKITITSKMGAVYGYNLLWVIGVAIFFMMVFSAMASRIGFAVNQSLLTTIRLRFGRWAGACIGIGIFLVCVSFQAGNATGLGIALGESTDSATTLWIILFNVVGIALLFFQDFYKVLERLMIVIVVLMLFSFLTTMFLAKPAIRNILLGLIPGMPKGSLGLSIAFFASCFSVVGAFYQSYLTQERKRKMQGLMLNESKGTLGIGILGVMSAVVLICAAAVLEPRGGGVSNASDMAIALEPLFGRYAAQLFLVGLFGASFSSLIGNATVGGAMLADGLGLGSALSSGWVKCFIALVMVVGSGVALAFRKPPLEVIVFAQSITIFLVPFIGSVMWIISNDKEEMGIYVSPPITKYAGLIGLILLVILAGYNVNELLIK
ncbi:Mn2+ and Fe2+ transporters of the NRAMP family [Parapedobacter composti]|uniref:Mn2+ and Fe2+ transporters of the NRAMP family n=1 Tax=Parapedobacter composti TaxID=623281 RepID=A0A1I1E4W2_9SPHI|nr:Nramp family divalent metal transporter [Parapedobacter composti]SFB82201.1 Mn2+ and Fe2+ transporters of the NRAMP family [Parapedobacter composti]